MYFFNLFFLISYVLWIYWLNKQPTTHTLEVKPVVSVGHVVFLKLICQYIKRGFFVCI